MGEHKAVRIWQERPREFSFECSCGTVNKHMKFGDVRCGFEAHELDDLGVIGPNGVCSICRHKHGAITRAYQHPCIDCKRCDELEAAAPVSAQENTNGEAR